MMINRKDSDHYTEIDLWNDGDYPAYQSYRITCMDIDIDKETGMRQLPTAHISLLSSTGVTVDVLRRLVYEYETVLGVADALQIEKRAAYNIKFSAPTDT